MSKADPQGANERGSDRTSRLSSALRDNLRRRKAASRPAEGPDGPAADGRANATPPQKAADEGRES